jgi:hypothetical protein
MRKRGPRPVVFVCVGIDREKDDVISKQITAASQTEAASLFLEQTKIKAKNIHGPYRPKRQQVMTNTLTMKFADRSRKAVYNNWEVTAFDLKEPENHAFLVFIKRVDDQKQPKPQGTIIVPLSDLRFE